MPRDVYQSITDRIVAELETGVRPWLKPWSTAQLDGRVVLPLRHNGVTYRGVNIVTLWMTALAKGYAAPVWMTFKRRSPSALASARARRGLAGKLWNIDRRPNGLATA